MQDVLYIDDAEQAATLLKPLRIELVRRMAQPTTLGALAEQLGETPQKLYYHVKSLEHAGLVRKVDERRVGGIMEGVYQAGARAYWLSPRLVGVVGSAKQARDQASLGYLLSLAEELQEDIAALALRSAAGAEVPSLGISAQIELPDPARRAAFMRDVQQAIQTIAEAYGATGDDPTLGDHPEGSIYRLSLACYPIDTQRFHQTEGASQ